MRINKIYHYADGSKAVFERNNGTTCKVAFSKSEYGALIQEELPLGGGVQTTEFCDYLAIAIKRENRDNTFQAVLDRYRSRNYTTVEYATTYNNKDIKGEVIYEDGKAVVITAATEDKIPHTLNFWRPSFAANLNFLVEKRLVPTSMR